jgi:hypothetical protein
MSSRMVRSTPEFFGQLPAFSGFDLVRGEAGPDGHSLHHQVVHLRFGEALILVVDFHVV